MTPQQVRNTNKAIVQYIKENPDSKYRRHLESGWIPDEVASDIAKLAQDYHESDEPMSDFEQITFDNWYKLHPDKIAGKMKANMAFQQPMILKGTAADVERVLGSVAVTSQLIEMQKL